MGIEVGIMSLIIVFLVLLATNKTRKNNQTIIHFHKKWENIVNNSKLKHIGYWCKDSKINTEELTNLIIKELSLDDFNIRSTTDLWISHL